MRPPRGVRRDLRLSIGDGAGYGLMAGVAEVYLPAFGLALGLSPVTAGLIASAPMLAGGLLQLVAPRAIARVGTLRGWTVACMVVQALAFVPLIVLAVLGEPSAPIVFVAASLYWAAGMAASASWNPWMARLVPARIRGRFFGRRQGLVQATMLVGLVGAGFALLAVADTPHVLDIYAVMFGLATVARLASALMLALQGRGVEVTPPRRMRYRSIAPRLRGKPRATLLVYIVAALSAAAISGPFLTPYLLDERQLGYLQYSVYTGLIVLVKLAALPVLGRTIHRVGVRPVLTTSAVAITAIPVLWIASDSYIWLLGTQVYSGVAWAGFELGMLMALFDGEDDSERTTMQSAFSAFQAIGTAGASFVGAAVLASLGTNPDGYLWVFLISALARLAAVILLVRAVTLVRLPFAMATRAWTLAIRPWGGTIVRPIVEGLDRLRRKDRLP